MRRVKKQNLFTFTSHALCSRCCQTKIAGSLHRRSESIQKLPAKAAKNSRRERFKCKNGSRDATLRANKLHRLPIPAFDLCNMACKWLHK